MTSRLSQTALATLLALAAPPAAAEEADPVQPLGTPELPRASDPSPGAVAPVPPPRTIVRHVPVASAAAGQALSVVADVVAADRIVELALYYRRGGDKAWQKAVFGRAPTAGVRFQATVPAEQMAPGVLEYYLASRAVGEAPGAPPRRHFASPEWPHPVIILGDQEARWGRSLLAQHRGNRSRFQLRSEYVNFGSGPDPNGNAVRDFYWRADGDYTYRFFGWVYSIRLGGGLLRGDTFYRDEMARPVQVKDRGLTYGFAELRFRFGPLIRVDVRATLGVGPPGFAGGGGGQLIIGYEPGTHFAVGLDGVTSTGVRGWLRLAWTTVPRVPMSFTLELGNLPDGRDVSGRVQLAAEYSFVRYFSMNLFVGYASRGWRVGGPAVGGGLTAEF